MIFILLLFFFVGVVLSLGFMYGKSKVNGFEVLFDLVGELLDKIYDVVEWFISLLSFFFVFDFILVLLVKVDDLVFVVINVFKDDDIFGIFIIE